MKVWKFVAPVLLVLAGCVTQEADQIVGTQPEVSKDAVWVLDVEADDLSGRIDINKEGQGELPLVLEKGESVSGMVTALEQSEQGDIFVKLALVVRGKLTDQPLHYCRYSLGYNGLIRTNDWLLIGSAGPEDKERLVAVRLRRAPAQQPSCATK